MAKSDGIQGPDNIGPRKIIGEADQKPEAPTKSFDSYMNPEKAQNPTSQLSENTGKPSPIDLAAQSNLKTGATPPTQEAVLSQMKSTSSVLGNIQKQLHTKNLTLKQSQKYLLRNKLKSAQKNIDSAAQRAGVNTKQSKEGRFKRSTPIEKFISYVTSGQNNLNEAQSMVSKLNSNGKQMSPGDLLTIQIKLSKAQQELEYSSVLLSKAVDDIKQMFNIQI